MFAYIDLVYVFVSLGLGAWIGVRFGGPLLSWYHGTEAFAQKLEAQAVALTAKAAAVRAAIAPVAAPVAK